MLSDRYLGLHSCDSTAKQKLCVAQRHFVKYDVCGSHCKGSGCSQYAVSMEHVETRLNTEGTCNVTTSWHLSLLLC